MLRHSSQFHVSRFAFHVLLMGALSAYSWIDGTPYFFEHFPNLASASGIPSAPGQLNAPQLAVGDRKAFFSIDFRTHQQYTVPATLRTVGEACYVFVEDSVEQLCPGQHASPCGVRQMVAPGALHSRRLRGFDGLVGWVGDDLATHGGGGSKYPVVRQQVCSRPWDERTNACSRSGGAARQEQQES